MIPVPRQGTARLHAMIDSQLNHLDLHERSVQSKHQRLREHLINQMATGRLKPGQKIPSEHSLVRTLGVARTTIRQAMASLENEGLIRRVQGKGTFVETEVRRKLHRGQDIFALVVPETREAFYPSLLHGFEAAAGEVHHQTIICNTGNDVGRQADVVLQLLDKEVGGVAIVPTSQVATPTYQVRQFRNRGIPLVFCHRRVEGISAPLLAIPFHELGRLAGQAFAEQDRRRVAYITSHRSTMMTLCLEGLQAAGCDVPLEFQCVGAAGATYEESVWASLQRIFAADEPPNAIFASFDSLAEVIYLLLPRLGLRAPQDVSLVGFGGAWREGALAKRLTSVVVDEIRTGRRAVELLHEMRRGDRPIDDDAEIVLDLTLSQGETLAVPATRSAIGALT
jgi:GntR family transcriptional regulator, arabinose operon transcriptional repressor